MINFFRIYKAILTILVLPVIFNQYFHRATGSQYGVSYLDKIILMFKMVRNNYRIPSASGFLEHLAMAAKILNIPKSIKGCLIECGSFKGGSSANLSLVSSLCHRKLVIFDSFKGLPQPQTDDKAHLIIDLGQIHTYAKGAWYGSLEEVRRNVARLGDISVCEFKKGYFKQTLPKFDQGCVFIFLDVDLIESVKTCLKNLWPKLETGGYLFTHEAHHMEIASLFFDKLWWKKNLASAPPGLIGAGNGLGLVADSDGFKSSIGYTIKNPNIKKFDKQSQNGYEKTNS